MLPHVRNSIPYFLIHSADFCRGYGYIQSGSDQKCVSTVSSGSIVAKSIYAPCVWESWVDTTVTAVPTIVLAAKVNGYNFPASTTSSSTTSSNLSSSISTSTLAPQLLAMTSSKSAATHGCKSSTGKTETHCESSLGAGAIAGIAIRAILGILILIAFLIFFRRRKCKQPENPETTYYEKDSGATPNELAGDSPTMRGAVTDNVLRVNHPLAA